MFEVVWLKTFCHTFCSSTNTKNKTGCPLPSDAVILLKEDTGYLNS